MKSRSRNPEETRDRLLQATVGLVLRKGFNATTVDEICAESGLTKGSFFHHFPNKEAIGLATVQWWGDFGTKLYAEAWSNEGLDPLEQLHRFFDIMTGFTEQEAVCTCVVGIMSQELAQSHPALRDQCSAQLERWTSNVANMLRAAKQRHAPAIDFDPAEVAWFLNSIWQGSMLIGKTCQAPAMIRRNLQFARAYIDALFAAAS